MAPARKTTAKKRTPRKRAAKPRPGADNKLKTGRPPIVEKGWNHLDRTWTNDSPVGKILASLRAGNYLTTSCEFGGVTKQAWSNWMARAREHHAGDGEPDWESIPESEVPYVALLDAAREAESYAEVAMVNVIRKCANDGDWRAAVALLSRRHPAKWRERSGVDVEMSGSVDLRTDEAMRILNDPKVQQGFEAIEEGLAALDMADQ